METIEIDKDNTDTNSLIPKPDKHFSHLFNSYSKYYNKLYSRNGTLFQRPFKRIQIYNERYFRNLVKYIHYNPVKHGFCKHILDYPWTSYLTIVSVKPTKLARNEVIGWFDNVGNFKAYHRNNDGFDDINGFVFE